MMKSTFDQNHTAFCDGNKFRLHADPIDMIRIDTVIIRHFTCRNVRDPFAHRIGIQWAVTVRILKQFRIQRCFEILQYVDTAARQYVKQGKERQQLVAHDMRRIIDNNLGTNLSQH